MRPRLTRAQRCFTCMLSFITDKKPRGMAYYPSFIDKKCQIRAFSVSLQFSLLYCFQNFEPEKYYYFFMIKTAHNFLKSSLYEAAETGRQVRALAALPAPCRLVHNHL